MENDEITKELSQLSTQITMVSCDIERLSQIRKDLVAKFTPLYQKLASSADSTDSSSDQSLNQ